MKFKPILRNTKIILSRNRIIRNPSFASHNQSEISNNNNASLTTNTSKIIKNSSSNIIIDQFSNKNINKRNIILPKISKNLQHSSSMNYLNSASTNISKRTTNLIENADKILKERVNNHGLPFENNKKLIRSVAMKNSKEICLKNYAISLMKEKRTEINEKARLMNKALKDFSTQFEIDHKIFINYIDMCKKKQKKEEEILSSLKEKREKISKNIEEEKNINKRLEEDLERKVRSIYIFIAYGSFLNRIFKNYFPYDKLPEINAGIRNYEDIANKLINIYEYEDDGKELPKELNDVELLNKKCLVLEDKIIVELANKEIMDKEIFKVRNNNENYLEQIKISKKDYDNDNKYLQEKKNFYALQEKKDGNVEFEDFKVNDQEYLINYMEFILDLGDIFEKNEIPDNFIPKGRSKENLLDYFIYCRKILSILENKEIIINNYVSSIDKILFHGDKQEKILMQNSIDVQRKINKRENQLKAKRILDEKENARNLRAIERSQRMVITGRKVAIDFPKIKKNIKISKHLPVNEDKMIDYFHFCMQDNNDNGHNNDI